MNTTVQKINTIGKIGYIICKIGKILTLIGASICLAGAIIMCFVPRDAVVMEFVSENSATVTIAGDIDLGGILDFDADDGAVIEWDKNTYKITGENGEGITTERIFRLSDIKWVLFMSVLACIAAYFPLLFAGKLCKFFEKCTTPFAEEVSGILVKLAVSLIPISIMSSLAESVSESVISGKIDISISVDLTVVIAVLCIFMLSLVFKYGTALQTESDETL